MTLEQVVIQPDAWYTPLEVAGFLRIRARVRCARALDRLGLRFTPMGKRRLYKGADVLAFLHRQRTPRSA